MPFGDPDVRSLRRPLDYPREEMATEIKGWLDLSSRNVGCGVSCCVRGSLAVLEANPKGARRPEGQQLKAFPEAAGSTRLGRGGPAR